MHVEQSPSTVPGEGGHVIDFAGWHATCNRKEPDVVAEEKHETNRKCFPFNQSHASGHDLCRRMDLPRHGHVVHRLKTLRARPRYIFVLPLTRRIASVQSGQL